MSHENYDLSFPDQPVVDQYLPVWAALPAFRAKPAFIWAETDPTHSAQHLTYSDLNRSAQNISTNLLNSLQKGDTVVILSPPGLELVELIFATQRAGLVSIPVPPPDPYFLENTHHHFIRVLSQTKPKAAIANSDFIKHIQNYITMSPPSDTKLLPLLKSLVWLSTDEIKENKNLVLKTKNSTYKGCGPDDVYLIQYTSGATSIPKPVKVSTGSAAHNVRAARKCYDLHPNSVITSWLPQYHDCGLMFLLLTIVSGATCVLTSPKSFINRPRLWLELITKYKATCTPVPSFTLPLVLKRGGESKGTFPINLSSMQNLILINEPIYKAVVDEFVDVFSPLGLNPSAISPSYGLAENCTFVSTAWKNNFVDTNALPCYKKLLPIARLGLDNNEMDNEIDIVIVNEETNEAVNDGVEGEIWISSPSNALGYLDHPSLTREIFQRSIKNVTGRTFLRTGDRGVIIGQERYVFIMGRCSDILSQNGMEIHPHYVETTIFERFPNFIRGGCVAAFEISSKIVIVAEMVKGVAEIRVLRGICEGIKEVVMKENGVDIGVVVLVKSCNVPKTTSGKVQRWLAKHKLLEEEMSVIMQVQFDDHKKEFVSNTLEKKINEFEGEGRCDEGRKVVDQEKRGVYLSLISKVSTSVPLHSSL